MVSSSMIAWGTDICLQEMLWCVWDYKTTTTGPACAHLHKNVEKKVHLLMLRELNNRTVLLTEDKSHITGYLKVVQLLQA